MENKEQEEYSRMVNGNSILLSLSEWIKYVEGLTKGLQTTDKVSSAAVLDCVGEILEFMASLRPKLVSLFECCENVFEQNEQLQKQIEANHLLAIEMKEPITIEDKILEEMCDGKDL